MWFFNGNRRRRKPARFKDTLKLPAFLFNFENKLKTDILNSISNHDGPRPYYHSLHLDLGIVTWNPPKYDVIFLGGLESADSEWEKRSLLFYGLSRFWTLL